MILDNVVELLLSYGAPRLPFLPPPEPQATPGLRVTLRHTYEVTPPNSVKIVFESTAAKAIGPDLLQVNLGCRGRGSCLRHVKCCYTYDIHVVAVVMLCGFSGC